LGVEGTRFLEGHLVITPLGFVPIRLASSCASLIGFSTSFHVTVTLLLLRATISVFAFAEALAMLLIPSIPHLRSARPPFLPPLFFSHGTPVSSFPIQHYPPASHPCAAHIGISNPPFLSSIPPVIPFFRALSPSFIRTPPLTYLPLLDSTVPLPHLRYRSVRTRRSSDYSHHLPFTQYDTHSCASSPSRRRSAASGHPMWRGVAGSLVPAINCRCLFPIPVPNSN
jgi:hypothetical protein